MEHTRLDTVVLVRDVPEHGLCAGDLGAVVEVYPPDGLEVEFVTASGRTKALVTLTSSGDTSPRSKQAASPHAAYSFVMVLDPPSRMIAQRPIGTLLPLVTALPHCYKPLPPDKFHATRSGRKVQ